MWYTEWVSDITAVIQGVLNAAGMSFKGADLREVAGQTIYNIETENHVLIGLHGDTVYALDMLVKRIVEKQHGAADGEERVQFMVDVNGYRTKRIEDLKVKALMMAERARSFQYDVELTPMNAYERLIVHTVLAEAQNIKTESQGEGRGRRVVIKYVA